MENTIWALFSIENEYNQPDNNLEAWWFKKPSIYELNKCVGMNIIPDLLDGKKVRSGEYTFRLEERREGIIKEGGNIK